MKGNGRIRSGRARQFTRDRDDLRQPIDATSTAELDCDGTALSWRRACRSHHDAILEGGWVLNHRRGKHDHHFGAAVI